MKKKILSLVLTGAMLLGTAAFEPPRTEASEPLAEDNYTFLDVAYSPEQNLYLAAAKDLTDANHPIQVYTSNDLESWTMTKQFTGGKHYANGETRQIVEWWDSQHVFVLQTVNNIYSSPDGETWTPLPAQGAAGSNTTIATNGDVLVLIAKTALKVLPSLDEVSETHSIDSEPENSTYGKAIGLTPEEPYTYAVTDQYKTWYITAGNLTSATPNIQAHPVDMIWSDSLDGWIVINETTSLRTLSSKSITYSELKEMQLSDGTVNTAKLSAGGVNDEYIVMGTETGKLYVAPNDSSSLTVNTQWQIVPVGFGEENTGKIRSVTAIDNGRFLVAADKTLLVLENTDEGWKYYDVTNADIYFDNTRIEVPETGSIKVPFEPQNLNMKGEISDYPITSVELTSSLPEGVDFEQTGFSGVLTIDSTAKNGDVVFNVQTENGKNKDIKITIVDADHIEIRGNDNVVIPLIGDPPQQYEYSAAVVGTDGKDMAREVSLESIELPEGAEFNAETKVLTITDAMQAGNIVLEATAINSPEDVPVVTKTVAASLREPRRVEFTEEAAKSVLIPNSGTEEFPYSVRFYDQTDSEIPNAKTVWSIEPVEIGNIDEVSIDPETGTLNVGSKAVLGTIKIIAAAEENPDVKAELTVELQYTDLRKTLEDQKEFNIDTSVPVTDDLELLNQRTYGSVVEWRSSNEDIIETDGTVNRPSRKDETVTFTEVITNGKSTLQRKFELLVVKDNNIVKNGGFEDGTAEGWQPKGDSKLEIGEENGNTVLNVTGSGVYVTVPLTTDSSYAFEGDIKAPEGTTVKLVSDKAGTLAELTATGDWQSFAVTYDYRNQHDSFDDNVYLECSGELTIDNLTVYEITLELNEVMAAVNKATYSKTQADIDAAKALVNAFYDLPIKDELITKLNSLSPSGGSGGSGGSSGGGGGGGGSATSGNKPPSQVSDTTNVNNVTLPGNNSTEQTADALDTYLLNFKDMKTHWARDEVEFLGGLDIITGDENGNFRPDDNITRAEFAALAARTIGLTEIPYENSFYDVVEDDWFSGWVQACRSNDLMNGYDGLFSPERPITREEIAKTVVSAYNLKANKQLERGKSLYFNDIDQISSWAYDYIAEAADMGFVNGVTEELFVPKRQATRAEAAVMLKRVYDELNGTGETEEAPAETEAPAASDTTDTTESTAGADGADNSAEASQ